MAIPRSFLVSTLLAVSLCPALACDTGGDGGDSTTGMVEDPCANDDRGDDYAVGLSRVGEQGNVRLTFVDAMPAPPRKGDNRWVLTAELEGTGVAVQDATFTVTPFMPDHGHGTPVPVEVSRAQDAAGTWIFDPVNLMMAGLWEITFDVEVASDTETTVTDSVVFRFCVDP